ncbi:MAG: leucyl aminopeptidase family protein [Candidatus Nanopelagicus sp.]
MNPKTFDLYPKLQNINIEDIDLSNITAVALPVVNDEQIRIIENNLVQSILNLTKLDLNSELSKWPEFSGKAGEIIEIPLINGNLSRIYLVGIGDQNLDDIRKSASALGRKVKNTNNKLLVHLTLDSKLITVAATALVLSNYQFSLKTEQNDKKPTFILSGNFSEEIEKADILAKAVWQARDLIHTPSNIKNPQWLAKQATSLVSSAKSSSLSIAVKSGNAIREFGGLNAVGNSSPNPGPRLIEVCYAPKGSGNWPHVVLVGKGITFDTGGVSLKRPYESMVGMKSDMAGAAAVLVATIAMARVKPKVKVTALLLAAENSLSATAQRPSDVIKQFGGTTVEVLNTDAEGRLLLADGLAYADLKLEPDYLIDLATLTGAATLGLGRQHAAMYTRNKSLAKNLIEIGEKIGERVWHMPLVDDYTPALESDVADINHLADKFDFSAGSITAALFLENFVGKRNWVHLDIAGTGRSETDSGEYIKGGTGFGSRLLIEWLETL